MSDPKASYSGAADSTRRPSNFDVEVSETTGVQINVSTKCTSRLTLVAALFIIIHNVLRVINHLLMRNIYHTHNFTEFEMLKPADVQERWQARRSVRGVHIVDEIAGIIGWMCVVPVIMVVVRIVSRGNPTSYVQWATPMFGFAVLIRMLEWTFNMGQRTGSDWMSSWPVFQADTSLPANQVQLLQVLEITYEMARFRDTWFYGLDWVFVGTATAIVSAGAWSQSLLSRKHAILGFIIGILGVTQWIMDILRLVRWGPFMIIGAITRLGTGTILFPIWLVWLGLLVTKYRGTELNSLLSN